MALRIYDTMRRAKAAFAPLDPARVRLYVCGPTVYDFAHIGNARPVVVFDVLYRLLRRLYGEACVVYARNVTDIDDKIIAAAEAEGASAGAVAERFTAQFHRDMAALGALPPDVEPRATAHVADMAAMVEALLASGHAYAAEGHVLFSVATMPGYGALSRRGPEELEAGARVEVAPYKRNPADFVLWKPAEPHRPGWPSPWGRGRPGWHLECSAMSRRHLGETFDIHGGGQDLIFPHHENEIAQSTCAHGGRPFVRYWMHNGYVTAGGEKMSKSLGNVLTVSELLDRAPGEAVRLALLAAHYRQPLDFTAEGLDAARAALDRLYGALAGADAEAEPGAAAPEDEAVAALAGPAVEALEDDLNTPRALAALHELASALNKAGGAASRARLAAALRAGGAPMGILGQDPRAWLEGGGERRARIEELVAARAAARAARDYAEADRLRDELRSRHGVAVLDRPDGGSAWRRA